MNAPQSYGFGNNQLFKIPYFHSRLFHFTLNPFCEIHLRKAVPENDPERTDGGAITNAVGAICLVGRGVEYCSGGARR